jgi:triphosphatase
MRTLTEFAGTTSADAGDDPPPWRKGERLALRADGSAEDAIVAAVRNGVAHMTGNEACVLARSHEEGVHQIRVAVRRLRSRISLYNGLLPGPQTRLVTDELKWLIGAMGPARDWDVFVTETIAPALTLMPDEPDLALLGRHAAARQERGYRIAKAALRSKRYARLKWRLETWAERRPWRQKAAVSGTAAVDGAAVDGVLDAPARLFAARVLEARHRKVLQRGESLIEMDAEERHRLRIQIKKLRYAVEFLESLFSDNAVKPYLAALRQLQDSLGAMNDLAVARTLTAELLQTTRGGAKRMRLAYAAGLVAGCAGHRHEQVAQLPAAWTRFASREAFWERAA